MGTYKVKSTDFIRCVLLVFYSPHNELDSPNTTGQGLKISENQVQRVHTNKDEILKLDLMYFEDKIHLKIKYQEHGRRLSIHNFG